MPVISLLHAVPYSWLLDSKKQQCKERSRMFTGIVQGMAEVVAIEERTDFRTHQVRLPAGLEAGLELGASVAHNGCCLTVTALEGQLASFDLMRETLRLTNLGELEVGSVVNVERAARFGDEIGGHSMSGHVMAMVTIDAIEATADNRRIWFQAPAEPMRFLFDKGYVGLDGVSLTIGEVQGTRFCVNLIPETLERTLMGVRAVGDQVNLEVDPQTQAIVETVERVMASRLA